MPRELDFSTKEGRAGGARRYEMELPNHFDDLEPDGQEQILNELRSRDNNRRNAEQNKKNSDQIKALQSQLSALKKTESSSC